MSSQTAFYDFQVMKTIWTCLLLNWINKCVQPEIKATKLSKHTLLAILKKYRRDVCRDEVDKALMSLDDVEPLIKYKYPILAIRYLHDQKGKDKNKTMYLTHSVLLFHCCLNSTSGAVGRDICERLANHEQNAILSFCEILGESEVTVRNVKMAISEACTLLYKLEEEKSRNSHTIFTSDTPSKTYVSGDGDSLSNVTVIPNTSKIVEDRKASSAYKSSLTLVPTAIKESSSYIELLLEPYKSKTNPVKPSYKKYSIGDNSYIVRSMKLYKVDGISKINNCDDTKKTNVTKLYNCDTEKGMSKYYERGNNFVKLYKDGKDRDDIRITCNDAYLAQDVKVYKVDENIQQPFKNKLYHDKLLVSCEKPQIPTRTQGHRLKRHSPCKSHAAICGNCSPEICCLKYLGMIGFVVMLTLLIVVVIVLPLKRFDDAPLYGRLY